MLMLALRNRTEPSPKRKLDPPGWKLENPFAAALKRQPSGAVEFCHCWLQFGAAAGKVFEFQLGGTVMPWMPPFWNQKLLSAARLGRTSPTVTVLLVPSVMLAMV